MYKRQEKINKVIHEIKKNLNKLPVAVTKAEISLSLWYLWEKQNPKLHKLRKGAERVCHESRNTAVMDANFKSALSGNVAAQCFYLKNNAGWNDTPLIDQSQHTHVNVHPQKVLIFRDLKEEDAASIAGTNNIHAEEGAASSRPSLAL